MSCFLQFYKEPENKSIIIKLTYMDKLNEFGKIIVDKLRDENFEYYLGLRKKADSMTIEEYYNLPRNINYESELQKNDDEKFELLNSLNEAQKQALDKLILNMLDSNSFNFLREVEENLDENKSIGLTITGEKIEENTNDLLSGTLFGEYFIWCEKFSKFGKYQY